jgi:hypothetical protein
MRYYEIFMSYYDSCHGGGNMGLTWKYTLNPFYGEICNFFKHTGRPRIWYLVLR